MSTEGEIPNDIRKILNNMAPPILHKVTAKLTGKRSEDKMSFVELNLYLMKDGSLPGSAEITIGGKNLQFYYTLPAKSMSTGRV